MQALSPSAGFKSNGYRAHCTWYAVCSRPHRGLAQPGLGLMAICGKKSFRLLYPRYCVTCHTEPRSRSCAMYMAGKLPRPNQRW